MGVEKIVVKEPGTSERESLAKFITDYSSDDMVVISIRSLGATLKISELSEILFKFYESGKTFHVLNKGLNIQLTDEDYLMCIIKFGLADIEAEFRKEPEKKEIKKKTNGQIGRPKIDNVKIDHIQRLYQQNKLTMREISYKCNVSLGSVFKYVKELESTEKK